jgi:hypothetical protein
MIPAMSEPKAPESATPRPLVTRDHALANHEAAHAVAAFALGLDFLRVSARGNAHDGPVGGVELSPAQAANEDVAVACLAGLAASEVLLGSVDGEISPEQALARRDAETANALVRRLTGGDEARAESLFVELAQRAENLLQANPAVWQRLTVALVAQGTLSRAEVVRLANEERRRA